MSLSDRPDGAEVGIAFLVLLILAGLAVHYYGVRSSCDGVVVSGVYRFECVAKP